MPLRLPPHITSHIVTGAILCALVGVCAFIKMSSNDKKKKNMSCANCGKGEEESGNLKSCVACKMVKYCNRECQIAHRPLHKKACKKRAAELHDEKLFRDVEPDECPICMLPLPIEGKESTFKSCCGKMICNGCIHEMIMSEGNDLCPFCRTPPSSSNEEEIKRTNKLMDKGNAEAFHTLAGDYSEGIMGLPQDYQKANELYLKAGELGCHVGYYNLGYSYETGRGVETDGNKAEYYYELAAMNGSIQARNNLGCREGRGGNYQRAYKHFVMAAKAGDNISLGNVQRGVMENIVSKDEYENTLRSYQARQDEMKSDARDKARASSGIFMR